MTERFVCAASLPQAYHKALTALRIDGDIVPCPAYDTRQKEISMTMVVEKPMQEPMISRCIPCGPEDLEQYRLEMLDGVMDFEVGKGNWAYTYHDRMTNWLGQVYGYSIVETINQIGCAIRELKRDPNTRRAVIDVRNNSEDLWINDPACLQHIQYFIREGQLHCKVLFRSNDAVKAAFMNAFALIMLQARLASTLGVAMGTYTHRANSFHAYERDWTLLDSYVTRIIQRPMDTTYNYAGDWDAQMAEATPRIMKKVEALRENT